MEPRARDPVMAWIVGATTVAGAVVAVGHLIGSRPLLGVSLAGLSLLAVAWHYRRRGRPWRPLDEAALAADPPLHRWRTPTRNRIMGGLGALIVAPIVAVPVAVLCGGAGTLGGTVLGLPDRDADLVSITLGAIGGASTLAIIFGYQRAWLGTHTLLWPDRVAFVHGARIQTWPFDALTDLRFADFTASSANVIYLRDTDGRRRRLSLPYLDALAPELVRRAAPVVARRLAARVADGQVLAMPESFEVLARQLATLAIALLLAVVRTFVLPVAGPIALLFAIALWAWVLHCLGTLWRARGGGLKLTADGVRPYFGLGASVPWEAVGAPVVEDDRVVLPAPTLLTLGRNARHGRLLPYVLAQLDPERYGGALASIEAQDP